MASPTAMLASAREKAPWLDHLLRAGGRYQADTGDRLAAAVTFFGFLSFFPLVVIAASLLTIAMPDTGIQTVIDTVNDYAPGLAEQLGLEELLNSQAKTTASVSAALGLAVLLYSGLGWVDALRESLRVVWHQNVLAGNFLVKKLKDVVVLAGLGATMVFSLAVSAAAGSFTDVALELVGLDGSMIAGVLVTALGTVLAVGTSVLLFLYLFIRLPRVQTPWRRVLKGAVLAAVIFEVLKRVGAIYIERTTGNPVFGIFAVAVGLLIWINLVSRMLLLVAAWVVTAPYDSDVAPSGTADPEQARKAGIPLEFADDDPDHPPAMQEKGAPSPLMAAVQGKVPPQDVPEGRPSNPEPASEAARRADGNVRSWSRARTKAKQRPEVEGEAERPVPVAPARQAPAPVRAPAAAAATAAAPVADSASEGGGGTAVATLPGEEMTRKVAQVGAGALSVGMAAVAVYGLNTLRHLLGGIVRR